MTGAESSGHAMRKGIRLILSAALIMAAAVFLISVTATEDSDADAGRIIGQGDFYYSVISEDLRIVELHELYTQKAGSVNIPMTIEDNGITFTVIGIGDSACKDVKRMSSITLPTSATYIGESAFEGCERLNKISGMTNVSEIGAYAFTGCVALEKFLVTADLETVQIGTFVGCSALNEVTLPESVTKIDSYAFQNCLMLSYFEIPENVTSLGDCAFQGCIQLKKIEMPDAISYIGKNAFAGCTALEEAYVSDAITELPGGIFKDCTALKNVYMNEDMTWLGSYSFSNCVNLKSITLSTTVKFIGSFAFSGIEFYNYGEEEKITDYGDLPGYTYVLKEKGKMIRQEIYSVHYDPNGGPAVTDDEPHTAGQYFMPTRYESGTLVCEDWIYNGVSYHYGDKILMPGEDITLYCVWSHIEKSKEETENKDALSGDILMIASICAVVAAAIALAVLAVYVLKRRI